MSKKPNQETSEMEDDDSEDEETGGTRRITISLSPQLIKQVQEYAEAHGVKKSHVIARALRGLDERDERLFEELAERDEKLFKELENITHYLFSIEKEQPPETKPTEELPEEITDEQRARIDQLLDDCVTFFDGFEIEGDNGFIIRVQERDLTGPIWTSEMLDSFAEKLSIAYDGYASKPDADELVKRCAEAMELSVEQHNRLVDAFLRVRGLDVEDETSEEASDKREALIDSLEEELARLKEQEPLDKKRIRAIETTIDHLKDQQEED